MAEQRGAAIRAWGYVRCSTSEQAVEGLSLDAQRGRISAWCDATGAELATVIEDAGISGSRSLQERPGGARIAALLEQRSPVIDVVVVARLDRLGRDAAETLGCLRQFAKGAVGLVSVADRIDLGTPQGRAMAQMSAVFAELERSLIAQRTAEALAQLRSEGRVYGPTPFGYTRADDRLIEDPSEQQQLKRILELRGRGKSYRGVADALNSAGVLAKRGGPWSAMSVRSVLLTATKLDAASR